VSQIESIPINSDLEVESTSHLNNSANEVDIIENSTDSVHHIHLSDVSKIDDALKIDPYRNGSNQDSSISISGVTVNVDNMLGVNLVDKVAVEGGTMKPVKSEKKEKRELSRPTMKQKNSINSQPLRQQQPNQLPQGRTAHRRGSGTICICTCKYLYICIYTYIYIYVCTYICKCIYVCIFIHIYICIYIHMYIYKHIYMYMYINMCIHIYIYMKIFICAYIHRFWCDDLNQPHP
jgi:hypothetical protein